MSDKNTGGPAFPCDEIIQRDDRGHMSGSEISTPGMTLRDYFAAKAMQAIIAKTPFVEFPQDFDPYNKTAIGAYDYADAMLEKRSA